MDDDQNRFEPDCSAEECIGGFDEVNCGRGGGEESDRVKTLRGYVRSDRFESSWGSWGMSGVESETRRSRSRSRSPERKELLIWKSDDEVKDFSDLTPVNVSPLAAVAPTDVIRVTEGPVFRVGVGLSNLGNTCFLNSILQCLVHTAPLTNGLCTIDHCSPCFDVEFCLICFLRELVHRTFTSYHPIAPYGVAANLRYFSPDFVWNQQEDAHEFLQCLLDKLEKFPTFSQNLFSTSPSTNLVKQVFGGSLVSRLRCCVCNHVSCTPEDLIDFSLEIDDVNNLEGALDSFTKLEKIEDIKLTCDGCNEKVSMEKQFVIDQSPLVASFHLKRFKNDGITVEKIGKHIHYPLSLNLRPYTVDHSERRPDLIYDLYAVVVHDGFSSDSGHYYSFVRTSPNSWHEFDDSTVTRVSESHVLTREAYILFYAKRGISWFSQYSDLQSVYQSVTPKYSPNSVLEKTNQPSESDSSTENLVEGDAHVNIHKEFIKDTYTTAFSGPRFVNFEGQLTNSRHGEYSNLLDKHVASDKNDVDMEGSCLNFDMLTCDEDKENRKEADVTINSFLNFDLCKDNAKNDRNEAEDKSGSCSSEVKMEATRELTCGISSLTNEECAAFLSINEDINFRFRNKFTAIPSKEPIKSLNCLPVSNGAPGVTKKNTIDTEASMARPSSCLNDLSHSPDSTKAPNSIQCKRSPNIPVDDIRKKQVLRSVKRMNMPMTRAKKLAVMNGSPHKKNKKSPISLSNKINSKNPNLVVSPSVRSAIFR